MKQACRTPMASYLHEWRKQAKYLGSNLRTLESAFRGHIGKQADQAHKLSDYLGDDHDLYELREKVAAHRQLFTVPGQAGALLSMIDRCQRRLRKKAFAVGKQIYEEKPATFVKGVDALQEVAQLAARGSETIHVPDRLSKGLRGLLRQVVSHAVGDRSVRVLAREFLGIRAGLGGATMAASVVGDDAIAAIQEEQHLRVPVIGRQWLAVAEHDGLTFARVLVENLRAIFRGDHAPWLRSSVAFTRKLKADEIKSARSTRLHRKYYSRAGLELCCGGPDPAGPISGRAVK